MEVKVLLGDGGGGEGLGREEGRKNERKKEGNGVERVYIGSITVTDQRMSRNLIQVDPLPPLSQDTEDGTVKQKSKNLPAAHSDHWQDLTTASTSHSSRPPS